MARLTVRTGDRGSAGEHPILLGAKLYAACAASISEAGFAVHDEDGPPGGTLRYQASKTVALRGPRVPRCDTCRVLTAVRPDPDPADSSPRGQRRRLPVEPRPPSARPPFVPFIWWIRSSKGANPTGRALDFATSALRLPHNRIIRGSRGSSNGNMGLWHRTLHAPTLRCGLPMACLSRARARRGPSAEGVATVRIFVSESLCTHVRATGAGSPPQQNRLMEPG